MRNHGINFRRIVNTARTNHPRTATGGGSRNGRQLQRGRKRR
jgi:hypothetical protein